MNQSPISILLCALGGEGGGVLSQWLVEIARHAGYAAQATSIPGVAQRTGATTYYLEVFPVSLKDLNGKKPVFGLNPLPGRLDLLVSSELLETARQIGNGLTSAQHSMVITSSSRALTTMEKMQLGDGRHDASALLKLVQTYSRAHHVLDMAQLTQASQTVVSATMLGCIAASGVLPFAPEDYVAVVDQGGQGGASAKASLRGFASAMSAMAAQRHTIEMASDLLDAPAFSTAQVPAPQHPGLAGFPAPVQDMLALGFQRLLDYQGADYANLYLGHLKHVLQAEQLADPQAQNGFATTREMTRWLALWMAYDDIVRVADLKSRASRLARVQGEVKALPDDLLKVYDHFKPGVPEFAAMLPPGLSAKLLAWDKRRTAQGKAAWALPLKVGSHSVTGMLSLRFLANLKSLRPYGNRYAQEQAAIGHWLGAVLAGTQKDWRLGHQLALCGRLIKGYGATNERAKENLLHITEQLAVKTPFASNEARADAIAAARTAALQDEGGKQFDLALVQHGAQARPVMAQPIRWVKTPPGRKAAQSAP